MGSKRRSMPKVKRARLEGRGMVGQRLCYPDPIR